MQFSCYGSSIISVSPVEECTYRLILNKNLKVKNKKQSLEGSCETVNFCIKGRLRGNEKFVSRYWIYFLHKTINIYLVSTRVKQCCVCN